MAGRQSSSDDCSSSSDAFGCAIFDYFNGDYAYELVERDDGHIAISSGPDIYFAEHSDWHRQEKSALRKVHGRVLDVGCGAGRHSLWLQEKGFDVTAIDTSPLAIDVARARGLNNARLLRLTEVDASLGTFDTILMLGNNFGLFENPTRARWLLRRLHRLTSPGAQIIGQCIHPYLTDNPCHLAYHDRNRQRGRMPGQLRIRVRYEQHATPWFDYLFVSPEEMTDLLSGTGWQPTSFTDPEDGMYIGIIEKA